MSIKVSVKTKKPATLKLCNHIQSYLFEEEYGEFEGQSKDKAEAFMKQLIKLMKL